MRILDRYIARNFCEPLLLSLAVLAGLYMVADACGNLDEFMRFANTITEAFSRLFRIYTLRLPTFVAQVLPIAMLLGAAYGISQIAGRNELMAMRACGISLWRVLAPVYTMAVVVSVLGLANHELLIPYVETLTSKDMKQWTGEGEEHEEVAFDIPEENVLVTMLYNVAKDKARSFSVMNKETGKHFEAENAYPTTGGWLLEKVTRGCRHAASRSGGCTA